MAKKEKKKKRKSIVGPFGLFAFFIILICVVIPNSDNRKTNSSPKATPEPTPYISLIEKFSTSLDDCSEYVNKETANKLYNFLQNDLGFSEIESSKELLDCFLMIFLCRNLQEKSLIYISMKDF